MARSSSGALYASHTPSFTQARQSRRVPCVSIGYLIVRSPKTVCVAYSAASHIHTLFVPCPQYPPPCRPPPTMNIMPFLWNYPGSARRRTSPCQARRESPTCAHHAPCHSQVLILCQIMEQQLDAACERRKLLSEHLPVISIHSYVDRTYRLGCNRDRLQ